MEDQTEREKTSLQNERDISDEYNIRRLDI